jgi:hypothetical protein
MGHRASPANDTPVESMMHSCLQQPETPQFTPQTFRHVAGARRRAIEVARGIVRAEIPPALERPIRPWLDRHRLAVQHEMAATDPVLVGEWANVEDALPAHDLSADHPVERAAVDDLGSALGRHAGGVIALARARPPAGALARLELLLDPVLKIPNGVAADAKFDEVKHVATPAREASLHIF